MMHGLMQSLIHEEDKDMFMEKRMSFIKRLAMIPRLQMVETR